MKTKTITIGIRDRRSALDGFRLEWRRFRDAVDHFVERTESK